MSMVPGPGLTAAPPAHVAALVASGTITTAAGQSISLWELQIVETDPRISEWSRHFRQQYCADEQIDALREGTGLSRRDYLIQIVFPDETQRPGPSIRAGDFAELLVADYVQYLLGYWLPRVRYSAKASRNESTKGVDILGFRLVSQNDGDPADTLMAFEVKAKLTGNYGGQLQTAIDDSSKDFLRQAESLNATKRRLLQDGLQQEALIVQRFQNPSDNPYNYRSGAAAVLSSSAFDSLALSAASSVSHNNQSNLDMIVIHGGTIMSLVHTLYQRAADEA